MNPHVFAVSHKADVIGIHAVVIATGVMKLPPMRAIGAGRSGDGSVHRFPRDPMDILRALAAFDADRRIASLAAVTALPLMAARDDVDRELALHTSKRGGGVTFQWHVYSSNRPGGRQG